MTRTFHTLAMLRANLKSLCDIHRRNSTADATQQPFSTVIIEGNIGSGKTQLLNYFQKTNAHECAILHEPIDLWRNKDGKNLLDLMYRDPKKHSFEFQQYVLETMHDLLTQPLDKPVRILERSFYSARYIFVENLWKSGMLTEEAYTSLEQQFRNYREEARRPEQQVDLIIYIHTLPEVVHERVLRRDRKEERSVSVDLLKDLHIRHEDWLTQVKFPLPAPVLRIDGNRPLHDVFAQFDRRDDQTLADWIAEKVNSSR